MAFLKVSLQIRALAAIPATTGLKEEGFPILSLILAGDILLETLEQTVEPGFDQILISSFFFFLTQYLSARNEFCHPHASPLGDSW